MNIETNELSLDELNFVTGGDRGEHNGTGDGPGTGPGMWIRLGRDLANAAGNIIKTVISVIPH